MKKSILQKPIKRILLEKGFEHTKNDSYAIVSGDSKTKIILNIPSGKNGRGFVLGAQFSDFGKFDGIITHAVMHQFDYAYQIAYPETYEYTEEQIEEVLHKLLTDYHSYITVGASAIKERIDEWTFGDFSERERALILQYFGLPGIDPYSEEYQKEKADLMSNGGMISMPLSEYLDHKDFYDNYKEYGAKIDVDEKNSKVRIHFFYKPKLYSQ